MLQAKGLCNYYFLARPGPGAPVSICMQADTPRGKAIFCQHNEKIIVRHNVYTDVCTCHVPRVTDNTGHGE